MERVSESEMSACKLQVSLARLAGSSGGEKICGGTVLSKNGCWVEIGFESKRCWLKFEMLVEIDLKVKDTYSKVY